MTFPPDWAKVRVYGTYLDNQGNPLSGSVRFEGAPNVVADGDLVQASPIVVQLDKTGSFSVQLPSTDDPDIIPVGWVWRVTECVLNRRAPFYINVPYNGPDINLATVVPAVPITPYAIYAAPVSVTSFGALGNGVDDTAALLAACIWLNNRGSGELYFPSGTYVYGMSLTSQLPTSAWKTKLLGANDGVGDKPVSLPLVSLRGARIHLAKGAILKRKDASCTIDTHGRMSWGMFNLMDCQDVEITGGIMDGNRAGQTNTIGLTGGVANHGVQIWSDCLRIDVHDVHFARQGTLDNGGDKYGDCVMVRSGGTSVWVHNNYAEDWGRWFFDIVLEYPIVGTQSSAIYIYDNECHGTFSEDGGIELGAIDLEVAQAYSNVWIYNNRFFADCKISCNGGSATGSQQTVNDLRIFNNTWDNRGSISSALNSDNFIALSGGWGVIVPSVSVSTKRRYLGCRIEGNTVISDKYVNNFLALSNSILDGLVVNGNKLVMPPTAILSTDSFMSWVGVSFQNTIEITNNAGSYKSQFVDAETGAFQQDFENIPFKMIFTGNSTLVSSRALRMTALATFYNVGTGTVSVTNNSATLTGSGTTFKKDLVVGAKVQIGTSLEVYTVQSVTSDTSAIFTGKVVTTEAAVVYGVSPGSIWINDNRFLYQTVSSTITSGSVLVKLGPNNFFHGTANTFTNVVTPGRGSAILKSGTTSIVVPTLLNAIPDFVTVTPTGAWGSMASYYISAKGSGTFTITSNADPAQDVSFDFICTSPSGG